MHLNFVVLMHFVGVILQKAPLNVITVDLTISDNNNQWH